MAKTNIFGSDDSINDKITHNDVNSHLLDGLRKQEGTKIVAKPTPITSIWADVRQPRRAIPSPIRSHWNGSPNEVPQLLNEWGAVVRQSITIDERQIIRGNGDGIDLDGKPSIVESYVSLLRLASDIKHVGLMNPITVVKQGQRHLIESGERRYLAHHLLMMWDDAEKWNKVPTIVSDGKDFIWRQATENTARRSLNAIGMARQEGLLIMDAREGMDGVKYNTYEELVLPGGCDRRFYAQVANGTIHGIPRGMGERIEAAMGISMNQIRQYRALLKLTHNETLNDILWVRADVEDWAEGAMRFIKEAIYGTQKKPSVITIDEVMQIVSRDEWSLNDIQDEIKQRRAALETDDSVTVVTVSTQNPPYEASASSSVLPNRKEPSTTTQRRNTEVYQTDSDPDLDHDAYYNRGQDTYTQSRSHDSSPPTIEHSEGEIKLHQLRTQHTQTINILIHFAKILNGQDITVARYTEDDEPIFTTITFEGDHLIKTLESYLNDSFQDIQLLIQTLGRDGMHDDIETANHNLLDIFEHLSDQVVYFMKSCIATVLDYSD